MRAERAGTGAVSVTDLHAGGWAGDRRGRGRRRARVLRLWKFLGRVVGNKLQRRRTTSVVGRCSEDNLTVLLYWPVTLLLSFSLDLHSHHSSCYCMIFLYHWIPYLFIAMVKILFDWPTSS